MQEYDYLIVGSGFAGSVLAERIANNLNKKVLLIDKRKYIGGNCYDYLSKEKILVQKYGPHIFHINNKKVFNYLSKFTKLTKYKHKVLAYYKGEYYPIPINLTTVNKFFNINLKNEKELKEFLETKKTILPKIKNSKDVVVSKFGEELYNAFIKDYTKKQWDKYPEELDKTVLERLPIRYNYQDNYFNDKYQGMPKKGFTKIFENMLKNKNITIKTNTDFSKIKNKINYKKLIFTGRIDEFFNYKFGKLEYRGIDFVFENHKKQSYQPNSVVNFPEKNVKFSRLTEFKKFYNIKSKNTIICKEFFTWKGDIAYPVFTKDNLKKLEKYKKEAEKLKNVYFVGRLAEYKYLNMDSVIENSLDFFKNKISKMN